MPLDTAALLNAMPRDVAVPADSLSELRVSSAGAFWLAANPTTGCKTLWHWSNSNEEARPLTTSLYDVGSRVNGYGGGAYACSMSS